MPTTTAPAARSRATTGWSARAGTSGAASEPSVQTSPATSTLSLIATGTPARGKEPRRAEPSTAAASASAACLRTTRKAPMRASTAAMWSRWARTTSTARSSPARTRSAISVAGRPTTAGARTAPLASMTANLTAAADTFRSETRMTYTGDVEVGGPADVRELPGLTISKIAVSEMANNAYLLRDTGTGEALLVDAAAEPRTLLAFLDGADVRTVVTTHGHWDHHRALPEIVEATGATPAPPPADAGDLPVPVQ